MWKFLTLDGYNLFCTMLTKIFYCKLYYRKHKILTGNIYSHCPYFAHRPKNYIVTSVRDSEKIYFYSLDGIHLRLIIYENGF